ncbi:hypothetical protein [Pontiella agarivorans]|uniref:Lipoprotein n=1 Tax=Pontiella agarivorans TaxID=3038953 RepID=A0ABU5MSS7_9BACT|nr:hypothetical protein [Pontiella agarivorans]MDZ8117183.1 hypothetical protein [Pontiella agarivorans]
MKKRWNTSLCILLVLAGCRSYQPASVSDGAICNPNVGWNGYSIRVPDGVQRLRSSADENVPDREEEIRERYREANERYVADYHTSYYEQFLFQNSARSFYLSFISETYNFSRGWNSLTSVDKQYIIQKMINRKKVIINDTAAYSEQLEINGQRGWYISGSRRPYFQKNAEPTAYEGIFLIGNLKEAFWIEAFGEITARAEMKTRVFEMAESLEVQ